MSRILEFIVGIFTFENAGWSAGFYAAMILLPLLSKFVGDRSPEKGVKFIRWGIMGFAVLIAVIGMAFFAMISGSAEEVDLSKSTEVDGKQVVAIEVRGKDAPWKIQDGQLYEQKKVDAQAAEEYLKNDPGKYAMIDGEFYTVSEDPGKQNVQRIIFEDGTSKKVVDGEFWDQDTVGSAIGLSMLIIYICFGLMLGFGILRIIENPKNAYTALIMVGALVLIFVIGSAVQGSMFSDLDPEFLAKMNAGGEENVTAQDEADAGSGIVVTMILVVMAGVAWVGGEIYNLVK